jgi:hypothetical protein
MDIQYALYERTPRKRANRLSDLFTKSGVYLRARVGGEWNYADYFAHPNLGDRPLEVFLKEFKLQEEEYDRKVFHHLLHDGHYRKEEPQAYKNHQLFSGTETLRAQVIKYKLFHSEDTFFHDLLRQGKTLRLDGNGMFTRKTFQSFQDAIPQSCLGQIEYMEDPMSDLDWSGFRIPGAQDFIQGSPAPVYIYKPNCEFFSEGKEKVIFSGYMGSSLGFWQAYSELMQLGDLSVHHGILVEDFYLEEIPFLQGSYDTTFIADLTQVKKIYDELSYLQWNDLCSI